MTAETVLYLVLGLFAGATIAFVLRERRWMHNMERKAAEFRADYERRQRDGG